jgi:hypothetical protein
MFARLCKSARCMPLESEAHELSPTACEAYMQGADRWIFTTGGILSLPEPFEDSFQPLALPQLGCGLRLPYSITRTISRLEHFRGPKVVSPRGPTRRRSVI